MSAAVSSAPASPADAEDSLARGVTAFTAGNYPTALDDLERAHAEHPDDLDVALLLAITYHHLKRPSDAAPLLRRASASPDAETAASARLFLALIAIDRGELDRAHGYLRGVADTPGTELSAIARTMLGGASAPRLLVVGIARAEYDSNVPLLPASATPSTDVRDASTSFIGVVSVRPSRRVPIVVDGSVSYRRQVRLTELAQATATLTAQVSHGPVELAAGAEAMALGGTELFRGANARMTLRRSLFDRVTPWVTYRPLVREYAPAMFAGYSGTTHAGSAGVTLGRTDASVRVEPSYELVRELAAEPMLVATGHGPRARVAARAGRFDASFGGARTWRTFDLGRRDTQTTLDATLAFDVSSSIGLIGGVSWLVNASSEPAFDHDKATAFLGIFGAISR